MKRSNEKIIAGLTEAVKGINEVIAELSGAGDEAETKSPMKKTVGKKSEAMNPPAEDEAVAGEYTKADLDAMKYNELKKLGASMGVSCKGTRDEITSRMLEAGGAEETEESVPAEKTEKRGLSKKSEKEEKSKVTPISKGLKKKEAEEIPAEFVEQAEEVMKETPLKDVIEALKEVGVESGNKKSEVTKALAEALWKNIISLDEDEEESGGEDLSENSYFSQYDPDGINDPENINSEDRAEAIKEMMKEVIEGIEEETLSEEDITKFLEDFATEEEKELLGEDYDESELIALYCEVRKHLIDDSGELHEGADPYEINEDNFCCGHALRYDKKSKTYICEVCGENYDAE